MDSEVDFLVPANDLIEKLKLSSESKARPELEDTDVVERCPNNRYIRYNEMLGRGAFKTVYKAFDEVEGIEVAWNQVSLDDACRSPEHLERVYSEVHLLKTLKHENIIKSYVSWVDYDNKTINMITELFTSGSLRQYRKKHKSVDLKAIKNWARQILRGLAYLHSHDPPIIHRDLKCDNIFVNGNHGEVKIGDLGLATLMLRPTAKSLIGTPEFMAPELYEEEYTELVDIYSFGMCILELITCEYPYCECKNQAQIYKKVTSGIKPAGLAKVKDPQVKQFIEKCLVPVSQRLPAEELLKDPFLAPESAKERVCEPVKPKIPNLPKLNSSSMDIDRNDYKSSCGSLCFRSNPGSPRVSSLEIQSVNDRNEIRLKGQKNDDNSILLSLRIADFNGRVRNIHFPFYLDADTAHSIAGEMVEQLDLVHEDIAVIAGLIDNLVLKFVPAWKPSIGKSSISSSEGSVIIQNVQIPLGSVKVHGRELAKAENNGCKDSTTCSSATFSSDWIKNSGVSCIDSYKTMSNDSSLCISSCNAGNKDGEGDLCRELKQELDAIDAQYHQWCSELHRLREEAIENAKKRWVTKKKVPAF